MDLLNFCVLLFALGALPGPNNVLLATSSMNHGYKATLAHVYGSFTSFIIMEGLAYYGVALITGYKFVEMLFNVCGVAYIFYLGFKIVLNAHEENGDDGKSNTLPPLSFKQAFNIQWVNTKAMVVILSVAAVYAPVLSFSSYMFGALIIEMFIIQTWVLFGKGLSIFFCSECQRYYVNLAFGITLIIVAMLMLNTDLISEVL